MRIAPLALTDATDDEIRAVSAITHAHPMSTEACVFFVHVLRDLLAGEWIEDAIESNIPDDGRFAFLDGIQDASRDDIRSTGYVLDTLGAALWCTCNTDSFEECVLEAVSLGDDSDTTACVAGALAGGGDVRMRVHSLEVDGAASRQGGNRWVPALVFETYCLLRHTATICRSDAVSFSNGLDSSDTDVRTIR